MKFKVNPAIDIQARDTDMIVAYPGEFPARLSQRQLPVIAAIETLVERRDVIVAMSGGRTSSERLVGELVDLVVLIPDDENAIGRRSRKICSRAGGIAPRAGPATCVRFPMPGNNSRN